MQPPKSRWLFLFFAHRKNYYYFCAIITQNHYGGEQKRDGAIRTTGTDIDKILPAMSRFGGGNRQEKKKTVIEKLKAFFEKYFGVI